MFKLLSYLKPHWKVTALAPLFMLVEVFTDLIQPILMSSIIDDGVIAGNLLHIQKTGLLMLGVALIGLLGGVGCTIFASTASQYLGADIRQSLFAKVQTFAFPNLDHFKTGSLVTRMTNDVIQVQTFVQMLLRVLTRSPLLALGSLFMAFLISPKLALILIIVVPCLAALLILVMKKAFPMFSEMQKKLDAVNTVLQESFSGIRVIKAFVRAAYEKVRFGKANEEFRDRAIKAIRFMAFVMPVMMLLLNGSIVAVLWFGGLQYWNGSISIGELAAFINYVTQMLFSLMLMSMMLVFVSRAKVSADRINEVLNTEPDMVNAPNAVTEPIRQGKIVFDRVSFSYQPKEDPNETEWVLRDIQFEAKPGQTVAILGATGSGKSSLVHLIARLYDATEGRVLIDDIDVKEIDMHTLRSHIGFVLQKAILFSGTIKENIAFGKPDASMEEIIAAAKAAQAHDFISAMPEGYDTVLGQRGVNLSGGQKQRISIARALLIQPKILIMDDSTSAVDLRTEKRIQMALKQGREHRTTIMIAQRISSVIEADRILVMDEGRIVADGTHSELLEHSDVYQEIYRSQLGEEKMVSG